jgi:hypothetical protein
MASILSQIAAALEQKKNWELQGLHSQFSQVLNEYLGCEEEASKH